MAREWLLRGVDPEELKAAPKDEGPQTPRSKWENFWYHHKLKFWLILFAVVAVTVVVVQTVTKDDPDYRVLLLSEHRYTDKELAKLAKLLEAYGEDVDGDGKVEIQIENCLYSPDLDQSKDSGIQQVQAHLASGDRLFFMWEPGAYEFFMETLGKDMAAKDFLATLKVESVHLTEEDTLWNWAGDSRIPASWQEDAPELYFGVRDKKGSGAKSKALYKQSLALLENFIADRKTNDG